MILTQAALLERSDIEEFSWFSLRAYHNTNFTAERILSNHNLKKEHFRNAQKQADQIRFFLLQAGEYFEASRAVSLVTRPVLLYYCVMCLATAEFLFKQSGDSSLDRARESHRHHGLSFLNRNRPKNRSDTTMQTAGGLIAQPAIRNGVERFGTFELWHRSARGYPIPGKIIEIQSALGGQLEGFGVLAIPSEERYPLLPGIGISLLSATKSIPGMIPFLLQFGEESGLVRASVSGTHDPTEKKFTLSITVHPGIKKNIEAFFEKCSFNANDIDGIEFRELPNCGVINVTNTESRQVRFRIPDSTAEKASSAYFHVDREQNHLNEFGFLYTALYIAGNYARYYPDYWIYDVERNTQLGMLIEHLLDVAKRRIGLLTLSELARVFYVPA